MEFDRKVKLIDESIMKMNCIELISASFHVDERVDVCTPSLDVRQVRYHG